MPDVLKIPLRKVYLYFLKIKYFLFGRPVKKVETYKAKERRIKEGFFNKYCKGKGLDIGYGGDLLADNCIGWDFENGDAHYLKGIPDMEYDFAYSSHTLEHMKDLELSLKNWWRVIKKGGFLILYLPHRDLYEKKRTLPSRWNSDHKHFFLPDRDEEPDTMGILPLFRRTLSDYNVIYLKECSDGFTITDPEIHSDGEYSIEVVLQKI